MTGARHARASSWFPDELVDELLAGLGGWRELGRCRQVDPELFYPVKGASAGPAKQVCAGCPVRAECLEAAKRGGERHGVWGGTTPTERDQLRRQPTTDQGRCAA